MWIWICLFYLFFCFLKMFFFSLIGWGSVWGIRGGNTMKLMGREEDCGEKTLLFLLILFFCFSFLIAFLPSFFLLHFSLIFNLVIIQKKETKDLRRRQSANAGSLLCKYIFFLNLIFFWKLSIPIWPFPFYRPFGFFDFSPKNISFSDLFIFFAL